MLAKKPLFAIVAVITLALGVAQTLRFFRCRQCGLAARSSLLAPVG